MMINTFSKATYLKGEEFYCSECDGALIHSDKPETGTFYQVFGHQYIGEKTTASNDYHSIIFALCPQCDKLKEIVKEIDHPL